MFIWHVYKPDFDVSEGGSDSDGPQFEALFQHL